MLRTTDKGDIYKLIREENWANPVGQRNMAIFAPLPPKGVITSAVSPLTFSEASFPVYQLLERIITNFLGFATYADKFYY